LLLRQSARFPYLAQALISSDGTTIIAAVLSRAENGYSLQPDDICGTTELLGSGPI